MPSASPAPSASAGLLRYRTAQSVLPDASPFRRPLSSSNPRARADFATGSEETTNTLEANVPLHFGLCLIAFMVLSWSAAVTGARLSNRALVLQRLWTAQLALDGYLVGQSDWTVKYAERHRAGLRVGTAITEGTANFLVNR